MAHFYGTLRGSRGEASRLGTIVSGLSVNAASWAGSISVRLWHDEKAGVDRFRICQEPHHGAGISETIAEGIVGQPAKLRTAE